MTFLPRSHPLRRASRRAAAIGLVARWLTAGSDGNEPTPPLPAGGSDFTAAVTVTYLSSPCYDATNDGIAIIGCSVSLRATGQGSGTASWRGATFRFFPSNDARTPFDSVGFSAQDVADS